MVYLLASEVRQLLHNKFVVILGDSVQRAVYKDLVLLLQKDCLLTPSQLRAKGEMSFEHDELVTGGQWGPMHNGTNYREVRQYHSDHHLVRFYFLTRVYSDYLKDVLRDLASGEHIPDVVVMNSCLWDLNRYGPNAWESYQTNLAALFSHLRQVLPTSCLLVWNTAMPIGQKIKGSFLPTQASTESQKARVMEANFYSCVEADKHHLDVLDLHFHFRRAEQHRQGDGVHWDERAHRHLSQLLLAHVADAWGVDLPRRDSVGKCIKSGPARERPRQRAERQPQASSSELTVPLSLPLPLQMRPPLLPLPPTSPCLLLRPLLTPQPHPGPFPQQVPQFLPCPQDAYFSSDHPFQSDQFSDYFHSDVPLSSQTELDFVFDPQPPLIPLPTPCYQQRAPVVHRGFRGFPPRGPYTPWRQRPRPFKRKTPACPEPRPQ
ncbi:PC-esterase domain-containing protein 1B [Talpa occidentalis]|uniref:PC-esterase domain-containing protein 1B n=1 Tax=Talpa occidentalis TaxID=50954 RepID=UPI0018902F23|nr:PC-esterase domain-containing protein 1B [Talpa occidentalis]XP_037370068.1 PC-esterase domain-containing protein 1B [Talpa occidentalis]XP_054552299.1 PC-esterase domain-containing protein 1B [Talpa occidentalis]XP_054552300.1 PC-esterase domain-containing protein 1B [Talpa occidentalis]